MNIFNQIKEQVMARDAALRYGLQINRNGMTRCPFHDDHTPSMKIDQRFYCFGCQASGDVITLTARLFNLSNIDAAKKLIEDFSLPIRTDHTQSQQSEPTDCSTATSRSGGSLPKGIGSCLFRVSQVLWFTGAMEISVCSPSSFRDSRSQVYRSDSKHRSYQLYPFCFIGRYGKGTRGNNNSTKRRGDQT